jgi:hypothetical protein
LIDVIFLVKDFLNFSEIRRILATRELDIVELDFLASSYLSCSAGFKAEFRDEVCEELVQYTFGGVEGGVGVAMGEEEVLNFMMLVGLRYLATIEDISRSASVKDCWPLCLPIRARGSILTGNVKGGE